MVAVVCGFVVVFEAGFLGWPQTLIFKTFCVYVCGGLEDSFVDVSLSAVTF